jgi:hypothetical protein
MDILESLQKFIASYPLWARIMAGGGIALTFFTLLLVPRTGGSPKSLDVSDRPWLIVKGVEFFGNYAGAQVKVTAFVNDTEFVYPSLAGVEWLEVGPTMAAQQFRLPPAGPNGYEIRFNMIVRERASDEPNTFLYRDSFTSVQRVFVKALPANGEYKLHLLRNAVRGPGVDAVIRFSVANDPNV